MGGCKVETRYGKPISSGIRRFEFDDYLLKRSGAIFFQGATLTRLERSRGEWIINNRFRSPMLVGAGGTFCPVARDLGAKVSREVALAAPAGEVENGQRQ